MAKKNVINLAKKKSDTSAQKNSKTASKKNESSLIELENDRDVMVKKKVEELLSDIDLTNKQKEEVNRIGYEHEEGIQWLKEQMSELSKTNDDLRKELGESKEEYKKLYEKYNTSAKNVTIDNEDSGVKNTVIKLFNEIQTNYINMGKDSKTGRSNLIIPPLAFMNRMVTFFPFLNKYKKI